MESVPKNFDWVKARAACSLEHIFLLLTEVVDSDVKSMLEQTSDKITLEKIRNKFVVARMTSLGGGLYTGANVVFELSKQSIGVWTHDAQGTNRELFRAKPSLTATGDCKLRIEGESELMELWQVSRKALEDLFFPE